MTCEPTDHDYRKFDEASVVCRKCGDQKVVQLAELIRQLPQPIYLPCPGPHYPYMPYTPWWSPSTTWPKITYGDSTSADIPGVSTWNGAVS